MYKSIKI